MVPFSTTTNDKKGLFKERDPFISKEARLQKDNYHGVVFDGLECRGKHHGLPLRQTYLQATWHW